MVTLPNILMRRDAPYGTEMSQQSLGALVAIYRRKHAPRIASYLDYFKSLGLLDDAIRFACHGKEGVIHGHQHLVGRKKLEEARKQLMKHKDQIAGCKSFESLQGLIENFTSNVVRFGVLAVYDTALRLGAYKGIWPELVYVHAGTKKGCKALEIPTKGGSVEIRMLPKPIRLLEPYQAEDFLCIFKDHFAGCAGISKTCWKD